MKKDNAKYNAVRPSVSEEEALKQDMLKAAKIEEKAFIAGNRTGKTVSQFEELTGMHFDGGKLRMDLIPPEAEEALAAILTYGCNKYAARNWESGIKFSRLYGSVRRHLHQWWKGVDIDDESGLHHLKHALCNIAFLITYIERNMEEFDDRT